MRTVNGSHLVNACYPIPVFKFVFAKQTAIANALSDVDALINSLEKLIAKKQAIKTATMQQLLTGKTRLPQFATHPDGTPYTVRDLGLAAISVFGLAIAIFIGIGLVWKEVERAGRLRIIRDGKLLPKAAWEATGSPQTFKVIAALFARLELSSALTSVGSSPQPLGKKGFSKGKTSA